MKTWTYDEITETTEALIKELVGRGKYDLAFGVWLGWSYITMNNQKEGDEVRLEMLISDDLEKDSKNEL